MLFGNKGNHGHLYLGGRGFYMVTIRIQNKVKALFCLETSKLKDTVFISDTAKGKQSKHGHLFWGGGESI